MMSMPPNPLLEDQLADPLWGRFLHSSDQRFGSGEPAGLPRRRADACAVVRC